jgi:hypothetical protein
MSSWAATPRQRNQIMAAVLLWRSLAEHSRTHPSALPAVRDRFDVHAPLDLAELDALIESMRSSTELTNDELATNYLRVRRGRPRVLGSPGDDKP